MRPDLLLEVNIFQFLFQSLNYFFFLPIFYVYLFIITSTIKLIDTSKIVLCNELLANNWSVVVFFNMMKLNLMKSFGMILKRRRYVFVFSCFVFFCLFLFHCFCFLIYFIFCKIFNLVLIQFSFSCETNDGRSFYS